MDESCRKGHKRNADEEDDNKQEDEDAIDDEGR